MWPITVTSASSIFARILIKTAVWVISTTPFALLFAASTLKKSLQDKSRFSQNSAFTAFTFVWTHDCLQNGRYFSEFFRRTKESAKRARSARHSRWGKALHETNWNTPNLSPSRVLCAPRSLRACLRSPMWRDKITPVLQTWRTKNSEKGEER